MLQRMCFHTHAITTKFVLHKNIIIRRQLKTMLHKVGLSHLLLWMEKVSWVSSLTAQTRAVSCSGVCTWNTGKTALMGIANSPSYNSWKNHYMLLQISYLLVWKLTKAIHFMRSTILYFAACRRVNMLQITDSEMP